MQDSGSILPKRLNLDVAYEYVTPDESPFIAGLESGINANPDLGIGTDNGTGEGQNNLVLTPSRSNIVIPDAVLPKGFNKNVGVFESIVTHELYYRNYNSEGNHGIYVYSGDTGIWTKVIETPDLEFSDLQEAYGSQHRATLRIRRNELGEIVEKYLLFTDGTTPHKWIDVIASIQTNGFTVPSSYWAVQPPHFDTKELIDWAIRSPMIAPVVTPLPNTVANANIPNQMVGIAFEFCIQAGFTDGRTTLSSPFSVPFIVKITDFLSNPNAITKSALIKLTAGSPKWEYINLFVRKTLLDSESSIQPAFRDWQLYDTIYKYTASGNNSMAVIGNRYWLRTTPWANNNYDPVFNTIDYVFDNTKLGQITDQDLFSRLGNEMPQLSVAMSDLGDAVQLADNREGYYNFTNEVTDKLTTQVIEGTQQGCTIPLREMKLYVYAGRERGNSAGDGAQAIRGIWGSQVGFYITDDKQMRWGGQGYSQYAGGLYVLNMGDDFDLTFADRNGFRCYLKGTPFFADCEWYYSDVNFNLHKLDHNIDARSVADRKVVTDIIETQGFFVGVFTFKVPAGRYIATLARHNTPSDQDWRSKSTYTMGIADSRLASPSIIANKVLNTVKPNAIVNYSKEIELDCTNGNIDLWGRGALGDLFYVFTPFDGRYQTNSDTRSRWQFIEGYLFESQSTGIPIECFYYSLDKNGYQGVDVSTGVYTDKNGFFFGYSWGRDARNNELDVLFSNRIDCTYPTFFTVLIPNGAGWKNNNLAYFVNYHSGTVGFANRVIVKGRITDITGITPYSNIAVSIVDGDTDNTDGNGEFTLIVHNGLPYPRISNIYINSGGSFNITLPNCAPIPLFGYNDANIPCQTTQERRFSPDINVSVDVQSLEFQSLKSTGTYINGIVAADIAGRVTFVSKYDTPSVQSFLNRLPLGNTNPTRFGWLLAGLLRLNQNPRTADFKWISFFTTNTTNYKKYLQWVGDKIEYIDDNGNVTTDTNTAVLVQITITSLLNNNIQKNFTLLSNYQYQLGDRLRVYDDGSGTLLNTATYGEQIDVQIEGTTYNQAAINANLIPPNSATVLTNTSTGISATTLLVKYDKRFDVLKNKTNFWIELYTPFQNTEKLPFFQIESWLPIINGEIATYLGGGISNPQYAFPTSGNLNYWDTYQIRRNILGVGSYIGHPFESANITDTWGANAASGGKANSINENAAQIWYNDRTIKSDDFVTERIANGLAMFREKNIKDFKGYQRGGIVAISCQYNYILFICENDWFITDYNYNYIFANAQGVQVANLSNNLGEPHQKIGQMFGCKMQDTQTVIIFEEFVFWIDSKNQAAVLNDYRAASDVSKITDEAGREYGIKSYLFEKIKAIKNWNESKPLSKRFDIMSGIDLLRRNIHVTFRPRRENTSDQNSFITRRRNVDLLNQETIVFNLDTRRWTRFARFAPEAYGTVRGNTTGIDFISFASGLPYSHNTVKDSFLNYYGIQTNPVLIGIFNKAVNDVKILQTILTDLNNTKMYIDLVYGTQVYGFSYLPLQNFIPKEKEFYAAFLRDMVSYLSNPVVGDYRSTLADGKRLFSQYFVVRFLQDKLREGQYFEMNTIAYSYTNSAPSKP
jgi:hypothetical protein